jgi:hypothetical protein
MQTATGTMTLLVNLSTASDLCINAPVEART